jgi:aminoglycoside 6'-N-acetyltransferase I
MAVVPTDSTFLGGLASFVDIWHCQQCGMFSRGYHLNVRIIAVSGSDHGLMEGMAEVLVAAFAEHSPGAWPDLPSAVEEVATALEPGKVCLAALADHDDSVLGWIGGQPEYSRVWELHPLAVRPDQQRKGIGRRLVAELEARVQALGCLTLRLGTDDEDGQTSLFGVDLYDDPLRRLKAIENPGGHAYAFYERCGFTIVGVIPDADGPGKPDILIAKRLTPPPA